MLYEDDKFYYLFTDREAAMVDVIMPTYNHEAYIKQAMDSVLRQKTKYSFRLIIGEDASTDRTRESVMKYKEKYPDKIDVILSKKNWGPNITASPMLKSCNAKYVAYLDGDDYWADDLKLEKQVSFLEDRKEYIGITGNVIAVDEYGNTLHDAFGYLPIQDGHIYGRKQVSRYEIVSHINCLLHRNIYKKWNQEKWDHYIACKANGDMRISTLLGMQGNIFCARDIVAFHRRIFHGGDSWTAKTCKKDITWELYGMKREINNLCKKILGISCSSEYELADIYYRTVKEILLVTGNKRKFRLLVMFGIEKLKSLFFNGKGWSEA